MELIGLALGLKVGGEGIRNRGLPWLQGLSAGWMGMAFTDMEGGGRVGLGEQRPSLDHAVSQPVTYQRGGITCKPGALDTGQGWI